MKTKPEKNDKKNDRNNEKQIEKKWKMLKNIYVLNCYVFEKDKKIMKK